MTNNPKLNAVKDLLHEWHATYSFFLTIKDKSQRTEYYLGSILWIERSIHNYGINIAELDGYEYYNPIIDARGVDHLNDTPWFAVDSDEFAKEHNLKDMKLIAEMYLKRHSLQPLLSKKEFTQSQVSVFMEYLWNHPSYDIKENPNHILLIQSLHFNKYRGNWLNKRFGKVKNKHFKHFEIQIYRRYTSIRKLIAIFVGVEIMTEKGDAYDIDSLHPLIINTFKNSFKQWFANYQYDSWIKEKPLGENCGDINGVVMPHIRAVKRSKRDIKELEKQRFFKKKP
jgi:hypothetical protein